MLNGRPRLGPSISWSQRRYISSSTARYEDRNQCVRLDSSTPSPYIRRYVPRSETFESSNVAGQGSGTDQDKSRGSHVALQRDDFVFYPDFFTLEEQKVLLKMALWKLDKVDSKKKRRRRRRDAGLVPDGAEQIQQQSLQSLFEDQSAYGFEEVGESEQGGSRLCHEY